MTSDANAKFRNPFDKLEAGHSLEKKLLLLNQPELKESSRLVGKGVVKGDYLGSQQLEFKSWNIMVEII